MIQQNSLRDGQHGLMEVKQKEYQTEAANRMLGINACADGRGEVANAGLRNSVHANWIVVAERVLQKADHGAEQHAGHWIAAAGAEINRHQKRKGKEIA